MARTRTHSLWFISGTFALASVIGFVSGASASPIVQAILPLLFGLISAGTAVIAVRKATDYESAAMSIFPLVGQQLLTFAVGFALGLWFGIAARFRPDLLWHYDRPQAVIDLDEQMIASDVSLVDRTRLLSNVVSGSQTPARPKPITKSEVSVTREDSRAEMAAASEKKAMPTGKAEKSDKKKTAKKTKERTKLPDVLPPPLQQPEVLPPPPSTGT